MERRYFLCSIGTAREFAQAAGGHWSIENGLHWVLDVACREDHNRTRKDHCAENFSVLRHIALNRLKAEWTLKVGIKPSISNPVGVMTTRSRCFSVPSQFRCVCPGSYPRGSWLLSRARQLVI